MGKAIQRFGRDAVREMVRDKDALGLRGRFKK